MASADWLKLTSPHAAGMGKHLDPKKRLESEHSNRDIDKSKSHLNITVGCETYGEALAAMRKRVKEVDKLYPPLKKKKADERVIAEMIEIKCPAEIAEKGVEAVYDFFKGIYKLEQDFFGAENVHGGFGHLDEIHEYTDKDGTKKISLPHIHTLVSCYCEWEEPVKVKGKKTDEVRQRQGINGKNFEKKPRYNQLNQKIDEYCLEHYGITYTKGKGKEAGHGKKVEELKAEEKLHQLKTEQNKARADREAEERAAEQARSKRQEEERKRDAALAEREANEAQSKELSEAIEQQQAQLRELQKSSEAIEAKKRAYESFMSSVDIPPFVPEPYPPKPELPEKYQPKNEPINTYVNYSRKFQNFDKELSKWQEGRDKAQAKIDKDYADKCAAIDRQNAAAKAAYDNKYLTPQTLRAVEQKQAAVAAQQAQRERELSRLAASSAESERSVQRQLAKAAEYNKYQATSSRFNKLFSRFIGNGTTYDEAAQRQRQKAAKPQTVETKKPVTQQQTVERQAPKKPKQKGYDDL